MEEVWLKLKSPKKLYLFFKKKFAWVWQYMKKGEYEFLKTRVHATPAWVTDVTVCCLSANSICLLSHHFHETFWWNKTWKFTLVHHVRHNALILLWMCVKKKKKWSSNDLQNICAQICKIWKKWTTGSVADQVRADSVRLGSHTKILTKIKGILQLYLLSQCFYGECSFTILGAYFIPFHKILPDHVQCVLMLMLKFIVLFHKLYICNQLSKHDALCMTKPWLLWQLDNEVFHKLDLPNNHPHGYKYCIFTSMPPYLRHDEDYHCNLL